MKVRGMARISSRSGAAHAAVSFAAVLVMTTTSGVQLSAAASSTNAASTEARAIARQLATAAAAQPIESCSADSTTASSPAMFAAGGAVAAGSLAPTTPTGLAVMCALPYTNGKPGGDCTGKHTITYQVSGASGSQKVTAELMALDANGNLLKSFLVQNGNTAQLASRLSPTDWKFSQSGSSNYTVFAPVPLLHVKVEDQGQTAEAYCSDIPYVDLLLPKGGVVSDSGGNETPVFAAVPLTDPSSLHIYVDGDDLLTDVPSFTGCTYLSPCSGTANINGSSIAYKDLAIDISPTGIATPSQNTVRVTLENLACGGHNVVVSSSKLPGSLKVPTSTSCDVDDLTDKGTSSVFAISISQPTPNVATTVIPTPVAGLVCAGTQITDVNVNGKALGVAGETHTTNAGGDVYTVPINTTLDQTDLVRDVLGTHDAPLGTFDAGTNRLAASAREIGGARAYKSFIFATGLVAPVSIDANAHVFQSSAIQEAVNNQLKTLVQSKIQQPLTSTQTDLQNAFIVGLSAGGTQTLFNQLCTAPISDPNSPDYGKTPGQIFKEKVTAAINSIGPQSTTPDVPCASDPTVALTITDVVVGNTVTCNVDFHNGYFHVSMGLPDIHVDVHAYGTGGDWGDDICVEGVKVEGDAYADVTGINLGFDVTENNLLTNTFSNANFNAGATVASNGTVGVDFCGASVLCNVVVTIFTFGAVDINPHIDFSLVQNFSTQIGANQPDPVKLKQIKVDENVVANFDQKLSGDVTEVHITPQGITAGLVGHFSTLAVDADVPQTPGITLTPATVPSMASMQSQGVKDALIGLSDDSINMMFASLTAAGKLKTGDAQGCSDTGSTVGSLLPQSCETITIFQADGTTVNDLATVAARGYCHAIQAPVPGGSATCDAIVYNNPALSATDNANLTATEQGECHGAIGDVCTTVANGNLVTWAACSITPNLNLHADQPLLFCAKGDVPPRMLFPNSGSPGQSVPTELRLNDLSVALVIDRNVDHAVNGALATTPSCFATGGSTAGDCNVFEACLDLNLDFGMQFLTCSDGKPGFKSTFNQIQIVNRSLGVVCGGTTTPTTDNNVITSASDPNTITIPIASNAGELSPDICGAGLDLGGFVTCANPSIISLDPTSPDLREYLGITCKIQ